MQKAITTSETWATIQGYSDDTFGVYGV